MQKIKRLGAAILSIVMLALLRPPVYATEPEKSTDIKPINVLLNGDKIDFGGVRAQIIHDYTYVPIANIIEWLAGQWPDWNDDTKTASFGFNGSNYMIVTTESGIYVDGSFRAYEVPPENVNGRILIPMGMLSSALGFRQEWDGAARAVKLTSPATTHVHKPTTTGPALVLLESAAPDKTTASYAELITVTVTTRVSCTAIKVQDAQNDKVAETTRAVISDDKKIFTLKFNATAGGKYCVYAATEAGYVSQGHLAFDLSMPHPYR